MPDNRYRVPLFPSTATGISPAMRQWANDLVRQLNGEAYLSIFSGTSPESTQTGIPGNLAVNVGVTDTDRLWQMSGTTARQKKTGWEAIGGSGSGSMVIPITAPSASLVDTTPPAALREFDNQARNRASADLTNYTQVRLWTVLLTASSATGELRGQYSVDQGSNWTYLQDGGTGPKVGLSSTASQKLSSWVTIQSAAQVEDVWLRLVHIFGDATASPAYGNISLEVR
jgi:hypothetical protein